MQRPRGVRHPRASLVSVRRPHGDNHADLRPSIGRGRDDELSADARRDRPDLQLLHRQQTGHGKNASHIP